MSKLERRGLSSDGQTPKPTSRMFKMADSVASNGESESFEIKMIDQMTIIAKAIENLQDGQIQLKSAFSSNLDKFRNEFMSSIDEKLKAIRTDLDLEIGKQQSQIESMSHSVASIIERLQVKMENTYIQYIGHQANRTRSLKTIGTL